jgi:hypothetical protein
MDKENLAYIHTVEYYLAIKNEITSFEGTWVEVEVIILNKTSQTQTNMTFFCHRKNLSNFLKDMKIEDGLCGKGGTIKGNGGEYNQTTLCTCMKMS